MTPLSVGLSCNTNLSQSLHFPPPPPHLYGVGLQVLLASPGRYGRFNRHDHFSPLELGKHLVNILFKNIFNDISSLYRCIDKVMTESDLWFCLTILTTCRIIFSEIFT